MRDEDIEETLARKKKVREEGKEAFDQSHPVRTKPLAVKDIVLQYDKVVTEIDKSSKTKLQYRWLGRADVLNGNSRTAEDLRAGHWLKHWETSYDKCVKMKILDV